jgi:hypothetical protein
LRSLGIESKAPGSGLVYCAIAGRSTDLGCALCADFSAVSTRRQRAASRGGN